MLLLLLLVVVCCVNSNKQRKNRRHTKKTGLGPQGPKLHSHRFLPFFSSFSFIFLGKC